MAATEAQRRAEKKYKQPGEVIFVRVTKEEKELIKEHASENGETMNEFAVRAINETMKRDIKKKTKKEAPRQ